MVCMYMCIYTYICTYFWRDLARRASSFSEHGAEKRKTCHSDEAIFFGSVSTPNLPAFFKKSFCEAWTPRHIRCRRFWMSSQKRGWDYASPGGETVEIHWIPWKNELWSGELISRSSVWSLSHRIIQPQSNSTTFSPTSLGFSIISPAFFHIFSPKRPAPR